MRIKFLLGLFLISVLLYINFNQKILSEPIKHKQNSVNIETKNKINKSYGDKKELNKIIKNLTNYSNNVLNINLSHDERIKSDAQFIKELTQLLRNKSSIQFTDEILQETLNYQISSKTKIEYINGNKITIRIINYEGLPELYGTLERRWTFIQWLENEQVNVQILYNKGSERVDDFLIKKINDKITVLLTGKLTLYVPSPAFLSIWYLNKNNWVEENLFANKYASKTPWKITLNQKLLVIELIEKGVPSEIFIKESTDGFLFATESNKNIIKFIFKNNKLVLNK